MLAIWSAAAEQFEKKHDFALATIMAVRGSSPRHVGTRFLVRPDGTIQGTIGGGLFEAEVSRLALEAMANSMSYYGLFSFTGKDASSPDMICGGEAEVLIEYVDASNTDLKDVFTRLLTIIRSRDKALLFTDVPMGLGEHTSNPLRHLVMGSDGHTVGGISGQASVLAALPDLRHLSPAQWMDAPPSEPRVFVESFQPSGTVFIFGAGHVGVCVAHLSAYVDFRVVVLDDRSVLLHGHRLPDVDATLALDSFERAFSDVRVDEDSYIVIVTRGHAHDKTVLAQALRTPARYVGMIGSRRKNTMIFQALRSDGFTDEDIDRVHAPIGLPIGGETPQEIALSIVAQMIQVRNHKESKPIRGSGLGARCGAADNL